MWTRGGCLFTAAVKTDPTCTSKCVSSDNSEGCEFIASTVTTPASCAATATWQLNSDKTACESSDGCKFTSATAGTCAEKSSDNKNILKISLLSLLLFLFLF